MIDVTPAEPGDELERLRALVGPSEVAYEALRADRDAAQQITRRAMAETGELRGRLTEMSVQLSRARQDQEILLRRADMAPWRRVLDRGRRRWSTSVVPYVSRVADRFRSS